MASKNIFNIRQIPVWEPTKTVLSSGDVERDAQYVWNLATKRQRNHEVWRLGVIHGVNHSIAVEARVYELWEEAKKAESTKTVALRSAA